MKLERFSAKTFGKRLRENRVVWARMTQKELAKATGLTAMHISHFERGRRLPSFQNFRRLVTALQCGCEYLLLIDTES